MGMTHISTPAPRLSDMAESQLRRVSTATLTTQLLRRGLRNTYMGGVMPLRPDLRMVGSAFTLRYAPAREDVAGTSYDNDTDVQRLAVEAIGEGQVLVIDARGETRSAALGNILATRIARRGAVGVVTDGAFRDSEGFRAIGLPSYASAGHETTSSVLHHPVDMNVPIGCGGVLVRPGDILVGDNEGVVVIPAEMAESVAHDAYEQELLEEWILEQVDQGASIKGLYPPSEETMERYRARDAGRS
jgi:regulator of RNase E activity RraA